MAYTITSTSVTSATVPVQILPVTDKTSWVFKPRQGSANVLVFPFSGTLPATAPASSASFELTAGQSMSDADWIGSLSTDSMQQGWAAVLETTGTATVDSSYRP